MTRQSISLTAPNDAWVKAQVGEDREYTSKSDLLNDLIRKARAQQEKIDFIRNRLIAAEQSGFVESDREEILAGFKRSLRSDD